MSIAGADGEAGGSLPRTLLGRDSELGRLYGLVDGVNERGGALVVHGEAGIGKSALLAEASARARLRGMRVVTTTGAQSEAQLAFAGLHQLLQPFLADLARLPAPQRRALEIAFGLVDGEAPDLFLIGLASLGLVSEAAAETPLLLAVEDAQWLDRPSFEVLAFVARRLEMEPAIVLFAVRDGVSSDIAEIALPELHLVGLSEDAARALLEESAGATPGDLRARMLAEAAGNPLALIELPAAALGRDLDDGRTTWGPLPLTTRLERAFAAKLAELDPDTQTVLLLAALEDGELTELMGAAEALRGHNVDPGVWTPAETADLGRVTAVGFRFRHPLVRSAVQQAASVEQRRRAHAALGHVLADKPDRAAWHHAAAAAGPDEQVAAALDAAAERARLRGGGDVAVAALERAAGLTVDGELRAQRLVRAGVLAFEHGRWATSLRLLHAAQQLDLPPLESTSVSLYLEVLEGAWHGTDTIRRFAQLAEDLVEAGEGRRALEALEAIALRAHFANPDDEMRGSVTALAEQIAARDDDPLRLSVLAQVDPVRKGGDVLAQIRQLSAADITNPDELYAVGAAASAAWADDLALPFLRAAAQQYRAGGRLAPLAQALVLQAWAELRQGDARLAMPSAAEGVRLAEETRQSRFAAAGRLAHAVAAGERGEEEVAERLIAEAEAVILPIGANPMYALVALARGRVALAAERSAEAYEHLARIFDADDLAYHPFVRGWVLADLADAALRGGGDLAAVRDFLSAWDGIAAATDAPHLRVQLSYAAAVLADDVHAEERFGAAIGRGTAGWPFYGARARLAYGAWLRRQRRPGEARAPLRQAAHIFDAIGLFRLADRARRELRASGETIRRAPEGWAQLTPQELQIAQLAADGLSNREIGARLYLSHRTVGTHLYRLYPKLGVTSRAQLRAALEPAPDDELRTSTVRTALDDQQRSPSSPDN